MHLGKFQDPGIEWQCSTNVCCLLMEELASFGFVLCFYTVLNILRGNFVIMYWICKHKTAK